MNRSRAANRPIRHLCAGFLSLSGCVHASTQITNCAIRWDAWYTNGIEDPAKYTAVALRDEAFRKLSPLHGQFQSNGNLVWAPSQATFDAEIRAAHRARLCWAYVMYGQDNVINLAHSMMRGLTFHRTSRIKSLVNYAIIVTSSLLDRSQGADDASRAIVNLIADSNYQQVVVDGVPRPLLFLQYEPKELERLFSGSLAALKQSIDKIRQVSMLRGLGNPYLVILYGSPNMAEEARAAIGADAISEYVAGVRTSGVQQWESFELTIEADWIKYAAATSFAAIPSLRSGADIRARCKSPPPFEHRFPPGFNCDTFYVTNPTLNELDKEFRAAASFIRSHQAKDPAHLLLTYAWSECDESGNCIMPTYGDPSGRKLGVIGNALR